MLTLATTTHFAIILKIPLADTGDMTQPVKCLPLKPENPEFNTKRPYKGERREPSLPWCPLSSTHSRWQKCPSLSIIKTQLKLSVLNLGNLLAKDSSETLRTLHWISTAKGVSFLQVLPERVGPGQDSIMCFLCLSSMVGWSLPSPSVSLILQS